MKTLPFGAVALVLSTMFFPSTSFADRARSFTGTDLYGNHIRAVSMGNAFTAVAKTGETALLYNPAGLATTYSDNWNVAFGLNTEVSWAENTENFAKDWQELEGESEPETFTDFTDKYQDDTQYIAAGGSGYVSLQLKQPLDTFSSINRLGLAIQRYANVNSTISFPSVGDKSVSFQTQSAQAITDDIEDILQTDFGTVLTNEQKSTLLEEIQDLKNNTSNQEVAERITNKLIQQGITAQATFIDMTNTGIAVSTLDQRLKIGLSAKNYRMVTYSLDRYPLAKAVAEEFEFEETALEKKGAVSGFDIGGLYSFSDFIPSWRPQIGLVWQNVGGADFGDTVDAEVVSSINLGASTTKEFGPAMMILATDLKDLTGNYYQIDNDGNKRGRTFMQRFHMGAEIGLWEAANMENRYIYLRAGLNQGQPTYGMELSLPWNLIRVGYGQFGSDLGNEKEDDVVTKKLIYLSLGGVI